MGQAKKDRTQQAIENSYDELGQDLVRNEIQQNNFDRMIELGVIVVEPEGNNEQRMGQSKKRQPL